MGNQRRIGKINIEGIFSHSVYVVAGPSSLEMWSGWKLLLSSSQGLMLNLQYPHCYMTTGRQRYSREGFDAGYLHVRLLDHVRLNK